MEYSTSFLPPEHPQRRSVQTRMRNAEAEIHDLVVRYVKSLEFADEDYITQVKGMEVQ